MGVTSRNWKDFQKPTNVNKQKFKTRRGQGSKKKNKKFNLKILGTNADGITAKKASLTNLLKNEKPTVFMIQETKLKTVGKLKINGFQIFETVRTNPNGGGGLALGISNEVDCEPILITNGDDETEMIVVEANINGMPIRFFNGYGPQENTSESKAQEFYDKLDEEIVNAQHSNCEIIIEMDFNAKLGDEYIKDDPNKMSRNGRIMSKLIETRNLKIVNSSEKCHGTITRSKLTTNGTEKSVIDYVVVSQNIFNSVERMDIDEAKEKVLTNYRSKTVSDHNIITCNFNVTVPKIKPKRIEIFKFRNKEQLKLFRENTENANELIKVFETNENILIQGKKWYKKLRQILQKSFTKIRITNKKKMNNKKTEIEKQIDLRNNLRKQKISEQDTAKKHEIEDKLEIIEEEIARETAVESFNKIKELSDELGSVDGTFSNNKMWKLKRKTLPRPRDVPTAKKNADGILITNPEMLKNLYLTCYQERLKHREIMPHFHKLKLLREKVFQIRMKKSKQAKSEPWSMKQLEAVLKCLKNGKAQDPDGLVPELFKLENIGNDLKKSLLILLNKCKNQLLEPEFLSKANIISIYKGKGERSLLENERGIFMLNLIRKIKEKLILNDIYSVVDPNMSESQVGGRSKRGIRDHLFVVHSVINSTVQNEGPPIDIQIYDISKMFDALWTEECCNDLVEAGVDDDKMAMIYKGGQSNLVAVQSPVGLSDRVAINNIVTQGGSLGTITAGVVMDQIAKDQVKEYNESMYIYKNLVNKQTGLQDRSTGVKIPSLEMVDDLLNISQCNLNSSINNAYLVTRIETKKLKLNESKCNRMHVGNANEDFCPQLKTHNNVMVKTDADKYLGDICESSGKNTKNIKARCDRGYGINTSIVNILKELCLGQFHFTVAKLLRESLLFSSILLNCETWFNITKAEIDQLEKVDKSLLRRILDAPSKSPTASLYLELGCVPIQYLIMSKRLRFLHYILNRPKNHLLSQVFFAQWNQPVKHDWTEQIKKDLLDTGLNYLTFDNIASTNKKTFKTLVNEKCRSLALKHLIAEKETLSKMKNLQYSELKLQPYLTSDKLTISQKKVLFKIRTRMIMTPENLGKDQQCKICNVSKDEMAHTLNCIVIKLACPELMKMEEVDIKYAYSSDEVKLKTLAVLYQKAWRIREQILQ